MEAFVLTDKVITREHMTRQSTKPRYLKRYDLPSYTPNNKKRTVADRKPLTPITFVNAPRTKDLLTNISS